MHEAKLCLQLLDLAEAALHDEPDARIVVLRVEVGDWSGVAADALAAAFPICAAGTRANGALLRIERVAGRDLRLRDLEVTGCAGSAAAATP
jgi:hydrogenase nickel incorporation protein HypA/HybF